MQPITNTENLIFTVKQASNFLLELEYIDERILFYANTQEIIDKAIDLFNNLQSLDLKLIDTEFWLVCDSLKEIQSFKKVFDVKFYFLLNWRPELGETNAQFNSVLRKDQQKIVSFLRDELSDLDTNQEKLMRYYYAALNYKIFNLKMEIVEMFKQWEEMAPNTTILPTVSASNENKAKFRLASKRKTDFLKILSAMYDSRLFETEDGYIASNKQELINEFGRLLGEDFSKYSASLSQSKNVNKETFLKPFTDIRKKAEEYFDK